MNNHKRILAVVIILCLGAPAMSDSIPITATPAVIVNTTAEPVPEGKFQATWESLSQYQCPEWFRDAKFGIWAHWGPQCQPEAGDWYARHMYAEGHGQYKFHVGRYGHPSEFGFKDVINDWKAQRWEPEKLVALYKRVGAKYFFAMANHHDNLDMWDSKYQPWNSVAIGPKKDIIAGWAKAARAQGLPFGVSVHASHAWSWYETAQGADKAGPKAGVPYDGKLTKADGKGKWWDGLDPQDLYEQRHEPSRGFENVGSIHRRWNWGGGVSQPDQAYCDKFYNRTAELVRKYEPDLLYFDDTALPLWPVSDAGLKIAAHFYNSNLARTKGDSNGVLFGKVLNDDQLKALTWDIERGVPNRVLPYPWQTDTCIGGWHYNRDEYNRNRYKSAKTVIHMLADIVSKNGNLLLNVPVRGDGSIDEKEVAVLEGIAKWMETNQECIFATRPWKVFGEGPASAGAELRAQGFNEGRGKPFTAEDIRYTASKDGMTLYAIVFGRPTGPVALKSLGQASGLLDRSIARIEQLGAAENIVWSLGADALSITPASVATVSDAAVVFKITLRKAALAGPQAVQGVDKTAAEVRIRYTDGVLVLRPLADDTVRVRFGAAQLPETPSFVLTQSLPTPAFKIEDGIKTIKVSTGKLQVVVDRESGALAVLDASGHVLLREPITGARKLTPTRVGQDKTLTVEQVFQSAPDEFLYGLGQFQDGIWNWRGIPLELRQLNTQIAVPMLISSKGYGLLWDNASLTDFNPADQEIALTGGNAADTAGKQPNATEDLAKTPMDVSKLGQKTGAFTTGEAGEYVFLAKDGDRRGDFAILVDGKQVAGVTNMWTPRGLSAKVKLPAHTTVAVGLRGGGKSAKLFARPLGDTTTFRAQMGEAIDYTFFYGPSVDAIVAGYRKATGEAPMWPKWAYGFWQCRERYSSQQQILDTVAEFRRRGIPMDLIVQDWQYWGPHGWGAYQWDQKHYPDPAALLKGIHDQNAKFMISVWCNPHGKAGDDFKQNNLLIGQWIDVFSQQGRDLRWKHLDEAFYWHGTDGWWGDATEPGDDGESLAGRQTSAGPGSRLRNAYPLFASRSLYEGQLSSNPDKRVCILTRSAYPGMQRYAAAAWSGDVNGDWITLKRQIPAGLNFSITGIPYWTTDAGGFFRPNDQYNNADYNELLARWFQWSTFCPILRIHGFKSETEFWKWPAETQKVLLAYNELRYRMLPYNYSVAWKVTSEGYTIMRPLAMDFPQDQQALALSDSYMFGPAFLVAPVTDPMGTTSGTRKVYLPAGTDWINFWTGEKVAGGRELTTPAPLETLPLFVRAGSIVPLGPVMQYATEKPDAPYEIRVYPGADGRFTIYEDDNETYAYKRGAHATIPLTWDDHRRELTLGARAGEFPGLVRERLYRVVFVKPDRGIGAMNADQVNVEVRYTGTAITIPAPRQ